MFRAGRDAFNKREKANEDYYVKQKEKEKYECPYPINPVYQGPYDGMTSLLPRESLPSSLKIFYHIHTFRRSTMQALFWASQLEPDYPESNMSYRIVS